MSNLIKYSIVCLSLFIYGCGYKLRPLSEYKYKVGDVVYLKTSGDKAIIIEPIKSKRGCCYSISYYNKMDGRHHMIYINEYFLSSTPPSTSSK